jgi:hypothetical protein
MGVRAANKDLSAPQHATKPIARRCLIEPQSVCALPTWFQPKQGSKSARFL